MLPDMLSSPMLVEGLGLLAGGIIMSSAIPQIVANMRQPIASARQSLARNLALTCGNLLWVTYGLLKGAPSIAATCMVAAVLNGAVVTQLIRARGTSIKSADTNTVVAER